MSSIGSSIIRQCPNCGHELHLGALDCPQCHALIHGVELSALAREAKGFETRRQFAQARDVWTRSLELLPPDSKQAEWIRDRIRSLEITAASQPDPAAKPAHPWARKLGPLAPIAVVLAKSKGLLLAVFKLKFLFSFFAFFWVYALFWGWRFGLGFAVCILIHELGHYVDIKRRGLPAEMPVFLPGLGAYVKWDALGVTKRQIAQISLAGPLAGWLAAAGCFLIYAQTHDPLWVGLARAGAVINVLNLIPVWVLDGGKAIETLGQVERMGLLAASLALWLYTSQNIFVFVAAGIGWRLFTKDKPAHDDWGTWLYYVAVLAALGLTLHALPPVPLR